MDLNTIGKNIKKYRREANLRQEDLAEMTNLSVTYIGMLERGEKIPSIESFLCIVNSLGVSADMILCDLLDNGYKIKDSILDEKLKGVSLEERAKIYDVIDTLLKYSI